MDKKTGYCTEEARLQADYEEMETKAYEAAKELLAAAGLKRPGSGGGLLHQRGGGRAHRQFFKPGAEVRRCFGGIYRAAQEAEVYLAAQCCEHLNRALILEREAAEKIRLGGGQCGSQAKGRRLFATAAYEGFAYPAAVEHIKAHGEWTSVIRSSACTFGMWRFPCGFRQKYRGGTSGVRADEKKVHWRPAGLL